MTTMVWTQLLETGQEEMPTHAYSLPATAGRREALELCRSFYRSLPQGFHADRYAALHTRGLRDGEAITSSLGEETFPTPQTSSTNVC